MSAVRVQKHQRAALRAAREAVEPLGCTIEVDGCDGKGHLRLRLIGPKGHRLTGLASSPKNPDHMLRDVRRRVVALAREVSPR